jgi:hypothetical protein
MTAEEIRKSSTPGLQKPAKVKLKLRDQDDPALETITADPPISQKIVTHESTAALATLAADSRDVSQSSRPPQSLETNTDVGATDDPLAQTPTDCELGEEVASSSTDAIELTHTEDKLNRENKANQEDSECKATPSLPPLTTGVWLTLAFLACVLIMGLAKLTSLDPQQVQLIGLSILRGLIAASMFWSVYYMAKIHEFIRLRYKDASIYSPREILLIGTTTGSLLILDLAMRPERWPGDLGAFGAAFWLLELLIIVLTINNLRLSAKLGNFINSLKPARARSAINASFWIPAYSCLSWPFLFLVGPLSVLHMMWSIKKEIMNATAQPQMIAASAASKKQAGNQVIIRYRVFATIERWIKLRYASHSLRSTHSVTPIIGAVVGFVIWFLGLRLLYQTGFFHNLSKFIAYAGAHIKGDQVAALDSGIGIDNLLVLQSFIVLGAATVLFLLIYYLNQPTHLEIDIKGIRLNKRQGARSTTGRFMAWADMTHVNLSKPTAKAHPSESILSFVSKDQKPFNLKLDAIESIEEKQSILDSIERWAPSLSRSADVIQILQAPADHSYTELWLQALSAPPKREKLKPLIQGAIIKDRLYEVTKSIGVGGQGFAYLATNSLTRESVVLKEFLLPVFVDINVRKRALEKFESEAKILKQLDHPNIVKLLDFFVEDHRAYLVLEHIDGLSIRDIVKQKGPLSEDRVHSMASQMCTILEYLHSQSPPVVHRDFTPDNLILRHDGTLKVIDFNVAQQLETTTTGSVVGKHAYLPPEQFRGMPTCQSDIYAMGATLHFMLTGVDPEPLSESHPNLAGAAVSERMDTLVAKATSQNLEDRFADVQELAGDLVPRSSIEANQSTNGGAGKS